MLMSLDLSVRRSYLHNYRIVGVTHRDDARFPLALDSFIGRAMACACGCECCCARDRECRLQPPLGTGFRLLRVRA
jgi:hypothetical protein